MQLAFFVRLSRVLLVVALAGLTVGCGNGTTATPVTKEQADTHKKDIQADRKEAKEARNQAAGKGGGGPRQDR